MTGHHGFDERPVAAGGVPDVLAIDEVAVGTGASIVVAVAATIALVLTVLVATLSATMPAHAMPGRPDAGTALRLSADAGGLAVGPAAVTYRITEVAPARDGTFAVTTAPRPDDSLAPMVVGGLLLAMLAATASAWRGLLARPDGPQRTRRPAPAGKPSRGR